MGGMFGPLAGVFVVLYFAVIATLVVLVMWVLILAIIFLRLRIGELRRATKAMPEHE